MMVSPPAEIGWSLTRRCATCTAGEKTCRLDLDRPGVGVEVPLPGGATDRLLGIEFMAPSECRDAWCRGGDLTAVCETAPGQLRATAMWRAAPPWFDAAAFPEIWCCEVVVSTQTALLESVPRVAVVADAAGGRIAPVAFHDGRLDLFPAPGRAPVGFLLARPDARDLLFVVHPNDVHAVEAGPVGDRVRGAALLFPAYVEKGVLLRSRVLAALGPKAAATDVGAWAAEVAAAFAASPPVLSA